MVLGLVVVNHVHVIMPNMLVGNCFSYVQHAYIYDIFFINPLCSFVYHPFLAPNLIIFFSFLVYLAMLFVEEARHQDMM